jgi:hypothetical protein
MPFSGAAKDRSGKPSTVQMNPFFVSIKMSLSEKHSSPTQPSESLSLIDVAPFPHPSK